MTQAAHADLEFIPSMPKDLAKVDIYLLTVGRGPQIDSLFGHSALRVIDHGTGSDLVFNWGVFDATERDFLWRFYRGELNYLMTVNPFRTSLDFYRIVEKRQVSQEQLLLTKLQKERLLASVIANAQPAARSYHYAQFRDNCATRLRDHLDRALGGKIRAAYEQRAASVTFRDTMLSTAAANWWIWLGIDMLANAELDRRITQWEEMFLPEAMRQRLGDLPAFTDSGEAVPGERLLASRELLVDLPEPPLQPNGYLLLWLVLGLPVAALCLTFLSRAAEAQRAVVLGTMGIVFGFWSAAWGTAFLANWGLSRYIEWHHNAGLWLFWPLDWLYVVYGCWLLAVRRLPRPRSKVAFLTQGMASAHVFGFIILLGLWLTGLVRQEVAPVLGSSGVIGLLFYGVMARRGAASELYHARI